MEPTTPKTPRKTPSEAAASLDPTLHTPLSGGDAPLAGTEPTSGPEGSTYEDYKKKATDGWQTAVDSGKQAVEKGKQWLDEQDLGAKAKDLGNKAKDLGSRAVDEINGLTTTQKAVGIGLIAAGVAFLLTRGSRRQRDDAEYRRRPARSPFSHNKPYGQDDDSRGPGRRGWGSGRYSPSAPNAARQPGGRASSGSGYTSPGSNARRDQGPASGSRYDANASSGQNPNNLDDLTSAF